MPLLSAGSMIDAEQRLLYRAGLPRTLRAWPCMLRARAGVASSDSASDSDVRGGSAAPGTLRPAPGPAANAMRRPAAVRAMRLAGFLRL